MQKKAQELADLKKVTEVLRAVKFEYQRTISRIAAEREYALTARDQMEELLRGEMDLWRDKFEAIDEQFSVENEKLEEFKRRLGVLSEHEQKMKKQMNDARDLVQREERAYAMYKRQALMKICKANDDLKNIKYELSKLDMGTSLVLSRVNRDLRDAQRKWETILDDKAVLIKICEEINMMKHGLPSPLSTP